MKSLFFALMLCMSATQLYSQITIQGVVNDTDNKAIEEVFIYNNSNDTHAHTNRSGQFELFDVSVGDELSISHIGYETQTYTVVNDADISIVMPSSAIAIKEIRLQPNVNSLNIFSDIDVEITPVNSSQEVLRKVPGLFIGQHAGGGKAEQIFLRGFDIDHGTDISIDVDGMPVNMVSHAHGQGYADMHFLIPETIDNIDFGKGPYNAKEGNFSTAGYVNFNTRDFLEESTVKLEVGSFNTTRLMGMLDVFSDEHNNAYIATEFLSSDGPFESSQNFNRFNVMGKYTSVLDNKDKISFQASTFTSKWDASGQIPVRAVQQGLIDRFGAIDDTEGGTTSRTNAAINFDKYIDQNTSLESSLYYSKYDFELFSNFTFFLNDPVNGDQIRQFEDRNIFGFRSVLNKVIPKGNSETLLQAGVGIRQDQVEDNELSRTLNRQTTLSRLALGEVNETNMNGFVNLEFDAGNFLINPSARVDYFRFNYNDQLTTPYATLAEDEVFVSPKLNIVYTPSNLVQLYLKNGISFHSNDTRVVVAQQGEDILPLAFGTDLGAIVKPNENIILNAALWHLFLEQEFVYVGDEAVVEPSGKTRRLGADFGIRYQLTDQLYFDSDFTYTDASSIDDPDGEDNIPLAPDFTAAGGLTYQAQNGLFGSMRYRYLDDRPANEDNSIVAEGYFITDLNIGYNWDKFSLTGIVENLFDSDWEEAQFATESRLFNEVDSFEEIHFTPGVPFFAKFSAQYRF